MLTNDTIPLTGYDGVVDGAPAFVDAANGDYPLQRTSAGIDMAPAADFFCTDGNPSRMRGAPASRRNAAQIVSH